MKYNAEDVKGFIKALALIHLKYTLN